MKIKVIVRIFVRIFVHIELGSVIPAIVNQGLQNSKLLIDTQPINLRNDNFHKEKSQNSSLGSSICSCVTCNKQDHNSNSREIIPVNTDYGERTNRSSSPNQTSEMETSSLDRKGKIYMNVAFFFSMSLFFSMSPFHFCVFQCRLFCFSMSPFCFSMSPLLFNVALSFLCISKTSVHLLAPRLRVLLNNVYNKQAIAY
jgi:hypothetical protein